MAKTTQIKLGYGGGAFINVTGDGKSTEDSWCYIMINSGSLTRNTTVPSFTAYNMTLDYDNSFNVREDVVLGEGLVNFSGSLNFALTKKSLTKLFDEKFLTRNNIFDLFINDGRTSVRMDTCYWNSFSIFGNPRQILTASLQFLSTNNQNPEFNLSREVNVSDALSKSYFEDEFIKYWQTGAPNVESFNLNFTREITPVYLNTNYRCPAYMRIGKLSINGNVSSWVDWIETKYINIANKQLKLNSFILLDSTSFNFDGIDDTGKYNYSFKMYNKYTNNKSPWRIFDNPSYGDY